MEFKNHSSQDLTLKILKCCLNLNSRAIILTQQSCFCALKNQGPCEDNHLETNSIINKKDGTLGQSISELKNKMVHVENKRLYIDGNILF